MMSILQKMLLCLLFTAAMNVHAQGNVKVGTDQANVQVKIEDAWARATHPGQKVGAAYMTLTSPQDATLAKVESNVTDSVEIHSMSMQNGIMKMRMLEKLPLTADKPYKLAPGGYHLMLFDLKKPMSAGEQLNLTLHFTDKRNAAFQQKITVPVKSAEADDAHAHHH